MTTDETIEIRIKHPRVDSDQIKAQARRWAARYVPETSTRSSGVWRTGAVDFYGYRTKTRIVVEVWPAGSRTADGGPRNSD